MAELTKNTNKPVRIIQTILFILLIAAAIWIFFRFTENGVGLVSDSVNYINGARSIAKGNGYFRESGGGTLKPITNFPPLYSIILSIPIFFGADAIKAAWGVSLFFFVLNIFLIILVTGYASQNRWTGLFGGALFLSLQPFLYFQFYAMSEPVFFFFTFLTFFFFLRAFTNNRTSLWFFCGISSGLAFLSRYVGIVSVCAAAAAILLFVRDRKGKSFLCFCAGALPLIATWLIRNTIVSGNAANRQILIHPLTAADLQHGVLIFWRWIFPERYRSLENPTLWMSAAFIIFILLLICFIILVMIRAFQKKNVSDPGFIWLWICSLYILGYLLMIWLTISLFDASVNIEERILLPAFLVMLLLLLGCFGLFLRFKKRVGILLTGILCAFFAVVFPLDTAAHLPRMAETGYGWAWEGWKTSPAMQIIRELPPEVEVYSNQIEAVSLWAGRGAYALLDPIDPSSGQLREGYDETMQTIREQVIDGKSVLVFFGVNTWVDGNNWVTQLCDGLPFIYQDTSEWVIGQPIENEP